MTTGYEIVTHEITRNPEEPITDAALNMGHKQFTLAPPAGKKWVSPVTVLTWDDGQDQYVDPISGSPMFEMHSFLLTDTGERLVSVVLDYDVGNPDDNDNPNAYVFKPTTVRISGIAVDVNATRPGPAWAKSVIGSDRRITLTWAPVEGAVAYGLYELDARDGVADSPVQGTSSTRGPFNAGHYRTYDYWITAVFADGTESEARHVVFDYNPT